MRYYGMGKCDPPGVDGDVTMVGRIGRGSNGDQLLQSLTGAGANVQYVVRIQRSRRAWR